MTESTSTPALPYVCQTLLTWIDKEKREHTVAQALADHYTTRTGALTFDDITAAPVYRDVIAVFAPVHLETLIPSDLGTCTPEITNAQRKAIDTHRKRLELVMRRAYTIVPEHKHKRGEFETMEQVMESFTAALSFEWIEAHAKLCRDYEYYRRTCAVLLSFLKNDLVEAANDARKCEVCAQFSQKRCSQCHKARYCSVACQREHWHEHKSTCTKPKQ